jgi:hypothetical protein
MRIPLFSGLFLKIIKYYKILIIWNSHLINNIIKIIL